MPLQGGRRQGRGRAEKKAQMTLPKVGITLGDPGGIGPEIVLKAFSGSFALPGADYVIFGSSRVLKEEEKSLGFGLPLGSLKAKKTSTAGTLSLREVDSPLGEIKKGGPADLTKTPSEKFKSKETFISSCFGKRY